MGDIYELTILDCPLLSTEAVAKAAREWVAAPGVPGLFIGSWRTEIGPLGRVLLLRRFDDAETLAAERHRALMSGNPFNAGQLINTLSMESYRPFPFLPPMLPDPQDAVFEFRTYRLKPGGLPATLAGWETALRAARDYAPHLRINLYALDGPPRIMHIWGFESFEQRVALRGAAYGTGVWPPKGGPENISDANSVIASRTA